MPQHNYKICLTGGGTGGSVTPLLAIAQHLISAEKFGPQDFCWIGSNNGLERSMAENQGLAYFGIHSGKLRRYFSWQNIFDIFIIKLGLFESLYILFRHRPQLIISAGSFVSVPVIIAGWLLRIPSIVHQMDLRPGLANKIMAPFAETITVTFEKSLSDYGSKATLVGNSVRPEIREALTLNKTNLKKQLGVRQEKPVLLVAGGGTGSSAINQLIIDSQNELEKLCHIIHLTGNGKEQGMASPDYQSFEFLTAADLAKFYCISDLVISRAGLGFITELAFNSKPSIIIPMPDSHQEDNTAYLAEKKAAVILNQKTLTPDGLIETVRDLLGNDKALAELANNLHKLLSFEAEIVMAKIIRKYI